MDIIMSLFRTTVFLSQLVSLLLLILIAVAISYSRKKKNDFQVAQELRGAKLLDRYIAYALDNNIIILVWYIIVQLFFVWKGNMYGWMKMEQGGFHAIPYQMIRYVIEAPYSAVCNLSVHMSVMLLFAGTFLYFFLSESGKRESSWGKRIVGLRVVRTDGRKARTLDILTRTLLKMFPVLLSGLTFLPIVWLGAGIIWVVYVLVLLFNKNHKTIYDLASGCIVVRSEHVETFRRRVQDNRNTLHSVAVMPQAMQPQPRNVVMPQQTVQQPVDMIPPMIPIEHLKDN